jgi:glucose/arabinose dehydrogenase
MVVLPAAGFAAYAACAQGETIEGGGGAPEGDTSAATGFGPSEAAPIACAPDNGSIELPEQFCASVFADGVAGARQLVVTPTGNVYVATARGVVGLRDADGDGIAERRVEVGGGASAGIAWQAGRLFVAENDRVLRYRLSGAGQTLMPASGPEVIVSGLASTGAHPDKTLAFGPGGELYVSIGSATNSCQVADGAVESPGIDPCPELEQRAGIWRFSPDVIDQSPVPEARFAPGLRSALAMATNPTSGRLVVIDRGREGLHSGWPSLFSPEEELALPAEALFMVDPGDVLGWPYCYLNPNVSARGAMMLAPEYGGSGDIVGRCQDVQSADASFPAHWSAYGMVFYTGMQFPERYAGGAFIAFHGSDLGGSVDDEDAGYNIVFFAFDRRGRPNPARTWELFADGFAGEGRPLPAAAAHRPAGLAVGHEGSLYVSDDVGGRVWRISFVPTPEPQGL